MTPVAALAWLLLQTTQQNSAQAPKPAPQNPSPMVEHTRSHPRLQRETPPGERIPLGTGTLYVPPAAGRRSGVPLLIFFHGGKWLPEVAAQRTRQAAIVIQLGVGSGTYAREFEDRERFPELLAEAEQKSGLRFGAITLGGWSAGCAAVREILRGERAYERVSNVLCIDGIHTGYVDGKPGPLESNIETGNLTTWLKAGRDAIAGHKRVVVTHSEIFPGTFASTTETADYLVRELGIKRRAVLRWGPMGTQQLSEARQGKLLIVGYAGNSAPDHVDQLHALPEYLRWLD